MKSPAILLALVTPLALAMTPPTPPELPADAVAASGYREGNYRAPTPASSADAWTVDTAEAQALLDSGEAVAVDVVGAVLRPAQGDLPADWLPRDGKPRFNIPDSEWLPNVGRGTLEPAMEAYFREQLLRITDGDPNRGLLFYCKADCWMSWNAVKRAASYGYTKLYWYPEGDTGWREAGLPLEESQPVPPPE